MIISIFCNARQFDYMESLNLDLEILPFLTRVDTKVLLKQAVKLLGWVTARYMELSLFRCLQKTSNKLNDCSVEKTKAYILSIFALLENNIILQKPSLEEDMMVSNFFSLRIMLTRVNIGSRRAVNSA
jgi:hypothetical protein